MPYKLNDGRGETLTEMLVSLLIAALSLMMFAGVISSAARVIARGRSWNADVNRRVALLEQHEPGADVTSKSGEIAIEKGSDKLIDDGSVTFYVTEYGGEDVISYAVS